VFLSVVTRLSPPFENSSNWNGRALDLSLEYLLMRKLTCLDIVAIRPLLPIQSSDPESVLFGVVFLALLFIRPFITLLLELPPANSINTCFVSASYSRALCRLYSRPTP
jgi:hypothetical protein